MTQIAESQSQYMRIVTRESLRAHTLSVTDDAEKLIDDNTRLENKLRQVSDQMDDLLDELSELRSQIRVKDQMLEEFQALAAARR